MELRSIINEPYPLKQSQNTKKIVHQLNNEGCKCHLCQKINLNENKVIKQSQIHDQESEYTKGKKEEFLVNFLLEYFAHDRLPRKIRFMLPQICVFDKGAPTTLITKRKDSGPIKIIRNKQKMNAFEIENFFIDGFVSHNNFKEKFMKQKQFMKFKNLSRQQYYNYKQLLKNESIVLVRFHNDICQMMTNIELTNLFKSKQRNIRKDIVSISTMVNSQNFNEIRVHVNLNEPSPLLERAKNEVRIINEDIKQKDFQYVSEVDEETFEEYLKKENQKKYLEYISLKCILLYSLRTQVVLDECLFKFVKGESSEIYLMDIQVYSKSKSFKYWGERHINIDNEEENEPETKKEIQKQPKKRPNTSPEKLHKPLIPLIKEESKGTQVISNKLIQQNSKIMSIIRGRAKTSYQGMKFTFKK